MKVSPRRLRSAVAGLLVVPAVWACQDGAISPVALDEGSGTSFSTSSSPLTLDAFSASTSGWSSYAGSGSWLKYKSTSAGIVGHALRADYSVKSYAGVQKDLSIPADWSGYASFDFHLYGYKTGNTIRVEIKENGSSPAEAELFQYDIVDNFSGWKLIQIPFSAFSRREWQPAGAPDDGFTRAAVWGYRFVPQAGSGSFRLDEIQLSGAVASEPVAPAPAEPVAEPEPDPAPVSSLACPALYTRLVKVGTASQLAAALSDAMPGDRIEMADGEYVGPFSTSRSGTAAARISLCGTRGAVIRTGSVSTKGFAFTLKASYWDIHGITVTASQQGIRTFGGNHNALRGILVHGIGQEAVKFHGLSSYNLLENSEIRDTGLSYPEYGEGVYLGSWHGHWSTNSGGQPDASNHNQVLNNTFGPNVTAEHIDAKEGTTGGIIRGNTFIGEGMILSQSWVDSWVELKGNGYTVAENTGTGTLRDGFQVHVELSGWGEGNVFARNTADLLGSAGYGFRISGSGPLNTVQCDNAVSNAGSGLSNVGCK